MQKLYKMTAIASTIGLIKWNQATWALGYLDCCSFLNYRKKKQMITKRARF